MGFSSSTLADCNDRCVGRAPYETATSTRRLFQKKKEHSNILKIQIKPKGSSQYKLKYSIVFLRSTAIHIWAGHWDPKEE